MRAVLLLLEVNADSGAMLGLAYAAELSEDQHELDEAERPHGTDD